MVSEAQKRADAKYKREKTHQLAIRFFPKDEAIWQHLQSQPVKSEYIKRLIQKDMESVD